MGTSRRDLLRQASMKNREKDSSSQESTNIVDDILQTSGPVAEAPSTATETKENTEPDPSADKADEAADKKTRKKESASEKKTAGRPKTAKEDKKDIEPASSGGFGAWDTGGDLSSRLKKRAKAEKKTSRVTFAIYPSIVAALKEEAEEIGCSVNDLANGILIEWYKSRDGK